MSVVDKEMWRQPNEKEVGHATQNGWVKYQKPINIMHTEQPSVISTVEDTFLFLLGVIAAAVVAALIISAVVIYL